MDLSSIEPIVLAGSSGVYLNLKANMTRISPPENTVDEGWNPVEVDSLSHVFFLHLSFIKIIFGASTGFKFHQPM